MRKTACTVFILVREMEPANKETIKLLQQKGDKCNTVKNEWLE
jgi:hypothetical protein